MVSHCQVCSQFWGYWSVLLDTLLSTPDTWTDLEFTDLFVDPSVRGQGQGRRLIQAVADIAKRTGCLRLQWLTKHDNVTARKLYDTLAESTFVQYRMSLS